MKTSKQKRSADELSCPSASAYSENAQVFGVVMGTAEAAEVAYLDEPVPLAEQLAALPADVQPAEVFRMKSRCMGDACHHYSGSRCSLIKHIVESLPPVLEALPVCSIRRDCRWFAEEKAQACLRCPQVVTDMPAVLPRSVAPATRGRRQLPVV
jgi:hypothetical protein